MPCDFTVWTPSWTGQAHFASISCVQFFSPRSWYLSVWHSFANETLAIFVYYTFVYSFSRSFQLLLLFFILENYHSKIIGYLDVMLTMCSAHCICFYEFKQDQLRSTRFNSITNYWTSFRFYKIFTALYLLLFVTIFEKYTRSWTVKRWPFHLTNSGCVKWSESC